jgi:NAD(P)-dependent dehydrogenase (short-subunit alcohol dehydrogenase family)
MADKKHAASADGSEVSPRKRPRISVESSGRKPVALLTGALGGIGSATAAVLRESGYEVIGMDRNEGECASDHFIQCDIREFHSDANGWTLEGVHTAIASGAHAWIL